MKNTYCGLLANIWDQSAEVSQVRGHRSRKLSADGLAVRRVLQHNTLPSPDWIFIRYIYFHVKMIHLLADGGEGVEQPLLAPDVLHEGEGDAVNVGERGHGRRHVGHLRCGVVNLR